MEDEVIDDVVLEIEDQEDEGTVSFGGQEEISDEENTSIIKKFRAQMDEREREVIALKRRNEELEAKAAPKPIEVGDRPRLEEFDYDEDKHNAALDEYEDRKVAAALQKDSAPDDDIVKEWESDIAKTQQGLQALPFADAKQIVESLKDTMPEGLQQGIAAAANDPATFIYALGKHPAKLQELMAIKNLVKQVAAIVRMEASMKVGQSRKVPDPDMPQRGNTSASVGRVDKELARLEAEADKTGNRTAVIRYKQSKKQA